MEILSGKAGLDDAVGLRPPLPRGAVIDLAARGALLTGGQPTVCPSARTSPTRRSSSCTGIGEQARGTTLLDWAEPLGRRLDRASSQEGGGGVIAGQREPDRADPRARRPARGWPCGRS